MTIISPNGITTQYDHSTATVSRAVDNKIYRLTAKQTDPIAELVKLSNLDNEDFKGLADFQTQRRLRRANHAQ